jgi:glycosyltransferase involved in cell wall biosynthesis
MAYKTLHITNSFHPTSGGIRTFYNALLRAANVHRRFVRVVVPGAQSTIEEVGEFGRIYTVAAPRSPFFDSRYRMMLPHMYAWPGETCLRKIFAAECPDLVEVCDKFWFAYLPSVLRRGWIPGVPPPAMTGLSCERLDDSMSAYLSNSRVAEDLSEFYMRSCYAPRYDFHIAVSDYIAAEIRRVLPDRMSGSLEVSPMGVDAEFFGRTRDVRGVREDLLRRLTARPGAVLLLYAGRLSQEKNLDLLASTLAKLAQRQNTPYRLLIAGEGLFEKQLRNSLEQSAPGLSLFLGQQNREQLAGLFGAVDIFLHPNPREPFGIAPLEAMAAGLPLVAPASGGLLSYANRENAWLAGATPEAFASAIENVVADKRARDKKTADARKIAAAFSWERVTANYFRLYDQFCDAFFQQRRRGSPTEQVLSNAPSTGAERAFLLTP